MLKVSFFGNCQLENIGGLIQNVSRQHPLGIEVLWTKPAYLTKPEEYIHAMAALDQSDVIYTQYHDTRWGIFATDNLRKSFPMKIVPTLESFASVPQAGEWNQQPSLASLNIHYMDFRMLDLYLKNVPADEVVEQYFLVSPKADAIAKETQRMVEKYRSYFTSGKVIFDYSETYENAMRTHPQSFHTYNHPDNIQMGWMLNKIMTDMGVTVKVNLDGPELLDQFQMPSLMDGARKEYKIFEKTLSMRAAAKIYYTYFNVIERDVLETEFRKSAYCALMEASLSGTDDIRIHQPQGRAAILPLPERQAAWSQNASLKMN